MNKRKSLAHIRTLIKARGRELNQSSTPDMAHRGKERLDPTAALLDIRMLARVALDSDDKALMKRDLEMIVTIVEAALPEGSETPSEAFFEP